MLGEASEGFESEIVDVIWKEILCAASIFEREGGDPRRGSDE